MIFVVHAEIKHMPECGYCAVESAAIDNGTVAALNERQYYSEGYNV